MAKAAKPSKKKATTKSPKKKKATAKKTVKKAAPKKKLAKKKAAKKAIKKVAPGKLLRRTASKPQAESVEAVPVEPQCKCKEKNGVFFLMVKQKNGKYKQSPLHAAFETLAECEAKCKPE